MTEDRTFSYQTRIPAIEGVDRVLNAYADLYGRLERNLFVDLVKPHDLSALKKDYLIKYGITARQFNACRVALEGKIESIRQARAGHIESLKEKISSLEKKILKIKDKFKRHTKGRSLISMKLKLSKLKQDQKDGTISLCFGGKKLFHAQYSLEANGYSSFEEWLDAWQTARSSEFFSLGSKDETAGNQSCVLTFDDNQKGSLRLRLPNSLVKEYGKYLTLPNIYFSYGNEELQKALSKEQALTYRFKKDKKGWLVFVSFKQKPVPVLTKTSLGGIGIDINANHIAITEIDPKGNPIYKETLSLNTYGKTKNQSKALIGDACKKVIALAKKTCKPLVIEKLDFTKKKATIRELLPKYARMLSSFSYSHIIESLNAKGFREGVEVHTVNPAMTSIIGRLKFSKRYGLTTHHSAALLIARRYYKFSEKPSKSPMKIIHKNVQVTCPSPVRKRGQHVWAFWRESNRKLKAVLAAHFRGSPCPS